MTRMYSIALTALAISAGATPLLGQQALADTKVFQASSICRGPLTFDTLTGAVKNVSKVNPIFAFCAINRDNTTVAPTSVQVTVVDNSSLLIGDGNFSCKLIPVSRAGVAGSAGAAVTTSGTNSNGTILTLPLPATVQADGTLTVSCKIPRRGTGDPSSLIGSIKVVEPDPGN